MLAHRLKHKIEIWGKTEAKNSIGAVVVSNVKIANVFADVQTAMGRTLANDDRVIHTNETTFIIRNYPAVSYSNYVIYNGNKYKIIGLQPLPDGSGQILKTTLEI